MTAAEFRATIPAELRALRQWVMWRAEKRKGKLTKIPYQVNGQPADSTDPETWTTFDEALAAVTSFTGIGFVFTPADPYLGIDLDHCVDPDTGELTPWAARIVDLLDSYAEISPSGTGIKIWVRAAMPGTRRKQVKLPADWQAGEGAAVEMYDSGRYFTVTGRQWGARSTVEPRKAVVDDLYADLFPKKPETVPPALHVPARGAAGGGVALSDAELVERAQKASNGAAFAALWHGDLSAHAGDHSGADLALANHLAFWCGPDPARIERLFGDSALGQREKWLDRPDYREWTIAKALEGRTEFYTPGRAGANGQLGTPRATRSASSAAAVQTAPLRDVDAEEPAVSPRSQRHRAMAAEFADRHRDQWLTTEGRQWYCYTAGVWVARPTDEIRGMLWEFVDARHPKGATLSIVNSVLDACATFPGWRVDDADLNAKPNLINVRNGVYDLDTGELGSHSPKLLQTVQRPFDFDPSASCPKWVEFLADVLVDDEDLPDAQLMRLVQEWFGYVLTPCTRAQKAMVWPGEGSNGKGVATGILTSLIGSENMVATDIAKLDHEYNRAVLRDKLLAVSSEVPTGALISDAPFKAIVAGDPIQGRYPHGRPFFFRPYVRILITCNGLPATKDQTYAYYRRLIIAPWNHRVEAGEIDPYLEDNLRDKELAGIFLWSVEGLRRLKAARWRFTEATAADRAMATYQLEGNSVAMWLNDRTELNQLALPETTARLFDDYRDYCERFGLKLCGLPRFGRSLATLCGKAITKADSARSKGWQGIVLLEKEPGYYSRGGRTYSDE